jgi:LTXXQ motif family protein
MKVLALAFHLLILPQFAFAQSHYAGMQTRSIKALSDQQIADLKVGRGMSMALPAELNGYPGPVHVLELADRLELTPDQRASIQSLFDSMKAEAIPLGTKLIAQEQNLDRQFSDHTVTYDSLKEATAAAAATQAELRDTHLRYHLATVKVLTAAQMRKYSELRGYTDSGHEMMHHHE